MKHRGYTKSSGITLDISNGPFCKPDAKYGGNEWKMMEALQHVGLGKIKNMDLRMQQTKTPKLLSKKAD